MRILKITTFSMLGIVSLALLVSACAKAGNSNNSNANVAILSNTAATNSNRPTTNNTPAVSNTTPSPAEKAAGDKVDGELQVGKSESVILYFGKESGDYAGYCFANDSDGGRAILAACKDREQCNVVGKVDYESACKVPGLEADLSASGRIVKVESVRSAGRNK
jgi:hypothetical protein